MREGALPENSRQLAISSELAHLTGWTVGSQVTLDLVRAWSVSGLEADGTLLPCRNRPVEPLSHRP